MKPTPLTDEETIALVNTLPPSEIHLMTMVHLNELTKAIEAAVNAKWEALQRDSGLSKAGG